MKSRRFKGLVLFAVGSMALLIVLFVHRDRWGIHPGYSVGDRIDSLHGVIVYYNGAMGEVSGRNVTPEGYNLGLNYQCVEFVKRYYYEHFNHRMQDSYGNAKDFFDPSVKDGQTNHRRGLKQYCNNSSEAPRVGDLVVFDGSIFNEYGHVAIISAVTADEVEIIQQNVGLQTRRRIDLEQTGGKWRIDDSRLLGWLRKY